MIDKVYNGPFSTNFMSHWDSYEAFIGDNSSSIIATTAWGFLVLGAMQVGLQTERLGRDDVFQVISWAFTVFSIVAVVFAVFLLLVVFVAVFLYNLMRTRRGEVERARYLRRDWRRSG
jgi:cbb3-type cytochrome oxidase subunit 3